MESQQNVVLDTDLREKNRRGVTSAVENIVLMLANYAAGKFPECRVYVNPKRQGVIPPALFLSLFQITKRRKLIRSAGYEVGFTVDYIPRDTLSETEKNDALFRLSDGITSIPNLPVQSVNSHETKDLIGLTGTVSIFEQIMPDDEIILEIEETIEVKKDTDDEIIQDSDENVEME